MMQFDSGAGGQAQFDGVAYSCDLPGYLIQLSQKLGGGNNRIPAGWVRRTTINGMAAVGRTIRGSASSSQVEATVFARDFGGGKANHFLLLTPAGRGHLLPWCNPSRELPHRKPQI